MSLFKKIAGAFVEMEEETSTSSAPVENSTSNIPRLSQEAEITDTSISSSELEKFEKHFTQIFESANLPGPDYFEFSKMCEAMASLPENTRYSAAFSGLSVQGLTKEKLIETAQHYVTIIEKDQLSFKNAIDKKITEEIEKKKKAAEAMQQAVIEKEEMIKKLSEEIQQVKQESSKILSDAAEEEKKIFSKIRFYEQACNLKKQAITADIEKIKTLI